MQQPHRRIMSTSSIPQDFAELADFAADFTAVDFVSSPATPDFTSINHPTKMGNQVTVSPKDLMLDASFPPSATFTDISTPSFDSPGYFSQNTSPLFVADSDLAPGHEHWDSLFPTDPHGSTILEDPKTIQNLSNSISASHSSSPALKGTDSSPEESPHPNCRSSIRPSSISGVKPRHREKPLPPIEYDPTDATAAKRARNTAAARKSRARKLELHMQMEQKIAELEASLEESRKREAYWKSIAEARE
ncbi:bZIP transcription factor CpcA, cross-pathway control protein [Histoplasma capsulatum var. duboisii H88]|uniref:BZIP transcription factor CpcA, cross-pathway control protein n=3 Tax=Ajellomyces capsulatus TaxID=5037 RepID=A0A8A1LEM9_AJEC8|nr:bZIP transcription factor CpcA, cross-pathway control protein [Histoplasma capsulatum var. duboisii H88]